MWFFLVRNVMVRSAATYPNFLSEKSYSPRYSQIFRNISCTKSSSDNLALKACGQTSDYLRDFYKVRHDFKIFLGFLSYWKYIAVTFWVESMRLRVQPKMLLIVNETRNIHRIPSWGGIGGGGQCGVSDEKLSYAPVIRDRFAQNGTILFKITLRTHVLIFFYCKAKTSL